MIACPVVDSFNLAQLMNLSSSLPPADGETGISAARRVYGLLRQRIVEMSMLPGTRIVEKELAEELGTSRTPVHEAVQRLAEEGLIEVLPRVGTFVARIPLDSLEEAMLVRCALETAIIEKATERATPEGIARARLEDRPPGRPARAAAGRRGRRRPDHRARVPRRRARQCDGRTRAHEGRCVSEGGHVQHHQGDGDLSLDPGSAAARRQVEAVKP